jgi:hypothetical protein
MSGPRQSGRDTPIPRPSTERERANPLYGRSGRRPSRLTQQQRVPSPALPPDLIRPSGKHASPGAREIVSGGSASSRLTFRLGRHSTDCGYGQFVARLGRAVPFPPVGNVAFSASPASQEPVHAPHPRRRGMLLVLNSQASGIADPTGAPGAPSDRKSAAPNRNSQASANEITPG